jgi:hypothetical protein
MSFSLLYKISSRVLFQSSLTAILALQLFTMSAQDAPVFQAWEEWAFLLWRMGGVVLFHFFHLFSFLDMPLKIWYT